MASACDVSGNDIRDVSVDAQRILHGLREGGNLGRPEIVGSFVRVCACVWAGVGFMCVARQKLIWYQRCTKTCVKL